MIRDCLIVFTIVLIVVLGHICLQNTIKENNKQAIGQLEELKEDIKNGKEDYVQEKTTIIYNNWKEKADFWSILVDHQEIDAIEKSILSVKASIEAKDMESIESKIDESIFLISLIEDREKLVWKNIF